MSLYRKGSTFFRAGMESDWYKNCGSINILPPGTKNRNEKSCLVLQNNARSRAHWRIACHSYGTMAWQNHTPPASVGNKSCMSVSPRAATVPGAFELVDCEEVRGGKKIILYDELGTKVAERNRLTPRPNGEKGGRDEQWRTVTMAVMFVWGSPNPRGEISLLYFIYFMHIKGKQFNAYLFYQCCVFLNIFILD